MNDAERLIQLSWHDNAAAWTAAVRQHRIESRVRGTDAAVLSAIRETGAARVLDIGCGEGWLCRALAEAGIQTVGFDATPELVVRAREAAAAGEYYVLSYDAFVADPTRVGTGFDAAVFNFSLLGRDIAPVLRAAPAVLRAGGTVIVQTVHPFADTGPDSRYEDGWRLEDFVALGADFRSPMPWYFRTVGSWTAELTGAELRLEQCREPTHPETGRPLSLLLTGTRPLG